MSNIVETTQNQDTTNVDPLEKCNKEIANYESGSINKLSQECFENFISQIEITHDNGTKSTKNKLDVTIMLDDNYIGTDGKVVPATMTFNPNEIKMASLTPIKITKFDTAVAPGTVTGTGTGTATVVDANEAIITDINSALTNFKNNNYVFVDKNKQNKLIGLIDSIKNILDNGNIPYKEKIESIKTNYNNLTDENKELIRYAYSDKNNMYLKTLVDVLNKINGLVIKTTKGGSSHRQKSRRNNKFSKSMKYAGRSTHKTAKKHSRRRLTRKTMRYSSSLV
jgi:hypothetical protein